MASSFKYESVFDIKFDSKAKNGDPDRVDTGLNATLLLSTQPGGADVANNAGNTSRCILIGHSVETLRLDISRVQRK